MNSTTAHNQLFANSSEVRYYSRENIERRKPMITCEIVHCATQDQAVRYDVKVSIAGVYEEIVGYTANLGSDPSASHHNRLQTMARQYALRQVSKSIAGVVSTLLGIEPQENQAPAPAPAQRRRRRTKAEMLQESAQEAAKEHRQVETQESTPEVNEEPKRASESTPEPTPVESIAAPKFQPLDNTVDHQQAIAKMVQEDYGPGWANLRTDVLEKVREFYAEAMRTKIPAFDVNGNPTPQLRVVYAQFVRSKCQP